MPLPGDLTTITVTANYPNIAGQPQSGTVVFDPGQQISDSTGHVILSGAVTASVFNGAMQPVTLPCTDNAGLNPTGFTYSVTATIAGHKYASFSVSLPHSLGSSVDLSTLVPVASSPGVFASTLTNVASTGVGGFALQNGTPNILSWTPPNDGNLHRFIVLSLKWITSGETGGQVGVNYSAPNGSVSGYALYAGGQGTGQDYSIFNIPVIVAGGQPVSVVQNTALTAGASKLWAEIWGL